MQVSSPGWTMMKFPRCRRRQARAGDNGTGPGRCRPVRRRETLPSSPRGTLEKCRVPSPAMGMSALRTAEFMLETERQPLAPKMYRRAPNSIAPRGECAFKMSGMTPTRREHSMAICGMCSFSASIFPKTATVPPVPPPVIRPVKAVFRPAFADGFDQKVNLGNRQPAIVAVTFVRGIHGFAGGHAGAFIAFGDGLERRDESQHALVPSQRHPKLS